jgi:uncharacterized protein YkvS
MEDAHLPRDDKIRTNDGLVGTIEFNEESFIYKLEIDENQKQLDLQDQIAKKVLKDFNQVKGMEIRNNIDKLEDIINDMENSVQRRQKEKDTPKIPTVSKSEKEAKILNDQS